MSRALMLQGTGSDVGKSLLAAGICRALTRRGLRVRPFKPQNMSNNAAVTPEGGEIGRAQALQARACGVPASIHMNPVLLKPQSEVGAQVVVQGRVIGNANAREYQGLKSSLLPRIMESFQHLRSVSDFVVVEGAGSPAEANLRRGDVANMGFATAARVPVVLVGDIERGGVIASLVGTHALLDHADRGVVAGYIVNKFRGDASLFDEAHEIIAGHTGWRSFGVVPYFDEARRLPAEDAAGLDRVGSMAPAMARETGAIRIAIPRLGRIANYDDFDPLAAEPDVNLDFVAPGRALPGDADLVILPGSKSTVADLSSLRAEGWDVDLRAHLRRGGWVLGICSGFQMLGAQVSDPEGLDGTPASVRGLGLLDVDTRFEGHKTLAHVDGRHRATGEWVRGYEMHVGRTWGSGLHNPMLEVAGEPHGAVSEDGRIMGCYLHGLFSADGFRARFLSELRQRAESGVAYEAEVERALDALAAHLERHVDVDALLALGRAPAQASNIVPVSVTPKAAISNAPATR